MDIKNTGKLYLLAFVVLFTILGLLAKEIYAENAEMKFEKIDCVLMIKDLFYAKNDDQKKEQTAEVEEYLSKYINNILLPKLISQGFKVKYLGVKNHLPTSTGGGILTIDYNESEGAKYVSRLGREFQGVRITCLLNLVHPITRRLIWADRMEITNPGLFFEFTAPKGLHRNALERLELEFERININLGDWKW